MHGYRFSSRAPRRGQALLLAVLIMIFAALLSASFISVVSVNLNQTARQSDKNRAFASAVAGLNYINRQLAYSDAGERWFEANYPAATLASYNRNPLYYTSLDRARNWAGLFAKFPDPNTPQGEGPQFLARVQRIPFGLLATDPEFSRAGSLKITIIGLSANDPTAYHTLIRYKGGYQQAPIAQNMRVVSNWDFKNGVVPVAQVAAYDVTTPAEPKITFTKFTGDFLTLARPFTVTVSNPRTGVAARAATVVNVAVDNTTTPLPTYTLSLAQPVSPAPVAEERIELAANLGAPAGIDYDNNPNTPPTSLAPDLRFRLSDLLVGDTTPPADTNQLDSARINGGLIFSGDVSAVKLRDINTAFSRPLSTPQKAPGSIMTSGVIALDNTTTAPNVAIAQTDGSNTDTLQASSDSPSGIFVTAASPAKYQLVSDGWNALKGVPSANTSTRAVTNFQPPALDSRENLERYRGLTRFSKPAVASDPATASLYGGGQGIYIDNVQDKERIYVTDEDLDNDGIMDAGEDVNNDGFLETVTGLREMRQVEIVKMLVSQPVGATPVISEYMRMGIPATSTTASLEQKHLRGWVGPDEFRGRGVEIELGTNSLTITRDARQDGSINEFGGVEAKTWKTVAGANQPGIYSRTFPWPQNGVIFAEGNVRIRGNAINVPRSLTVVSMGNIYIEDSLSAETDADADTTPDLQTATSPRKILLLARKNVVMNPTRVLGRPDAQTTATGAQTVAVGAGATLAVADGLSFKRGDFIQASTVASGTETVLAQGYITADPTSTQITFTATSGGAVPDGALVRTPTSVVRTGPTTPVRNIPFTSVVNPTDALQRRLNLPDPLPATLLPANLRLAFNHQADRVPVFRAGVTASAFMEPVLFSNKGVFITPPPQNPPPYLNANATVVAQVDKRIRGQYTQPAPGEDDFPGTAPSNPSPFPAPTTEAEARDQNRNLAAISIQMNTTPHAAPGPNPATWSYDTSTPPPGAPPAAAAYAALPFFYLAGVGNRLDFALNPNPNPIPTGAERRPNIRTAFYDVPLATSISVFANGVQTFLSNENWNTAVTPNRYDRTNQFGFRPTYMDTGNPNDPQEDVLTGDQSFYQVDTIKSTIDSRQLGAGLAAGSTSLLLRQSEDLLPLPVTVPPTNYPEYRLQGLKLENVGLVASSDNIDTIDPAHTFNVNAFVYAQTGSWLVIPGGLFDERLKSISTGGVTTTFLDLNGNNGADPDEFILDPNGSGNGYPDLNRNGAVDDVERYAIARYSRYNYAINFTGAIAENQTALVNDVRNAAGELLVAGGVANWMNSWATYQKATGSTTITNDRMKYRFDPTIALGDRLGGLQQDDPATPAYDADTGFRLPQTPSLVSIG